MRGIMYKTGVECIGKANGYYVFNDTINDSYGVTKDTGQDDIHPPHCGYYSLEALLKLKDIPLRGLDHL